SAGYERDLGDYMRARDEFWTNQDRQYAILDREAGRGMDAANAYGNHMMGAYGSMGDYAMGSANAAAAGTQARGQAWGGAASDIGNSVGGLAMYGGMYGKGNTGIAGGAKYAPANNYASARNPGITTTMGGGGGQRYNSATHGYGN